MCQPMHVYFGVLGKKKTGIRLNPKEYTVLNMKNVLSSFFAVTGTTLSGFPFSFYKCLLSLKRTELDACFNRTSCGYVREVARTGGPQQYPPL